MIKNSSFERFGALSKRILQLLCPPIYAAVFSKYSERRCLKTFLGFSGGIFLGQLYYGCLLKKIPFPYHSGIILSWILSLLWGIGMAISTQIRCISLLLLPMYCGKPGRGVLKAVVLTYVVAGPITNMGLNAKEVVRVFACSTQLSYNLSEVKYSLLAQPFRDSLLGLTREIGEVKDAFRSFHKVAAPIETEIEGTNEVLLTREDIDAIDHLFGETHRSRDIDKKFRVKIQDVEYEIFQKNYLKKMQYRCEYELSRSVANCMNQFRSAYNDCYQAIPWPAAISLCWPMQIAFVCNILHVVGGPTACDSTRQINPGLGVGYLYLRKVEEELNEDFENVQLKYQENLEMAQYDIQDAKETGERVIYAFEEKNTIMRTAIVVLNIFLALLFLRVWVAAQAYHDLYLTSIDHDNVYITDYFKRIDYRRKMTNEYTLLPLKKMERSKYIDVYSKTLSAEHHKLVTQVLKVLLEVVTATTFVMLDRLFYEALDVVRQHAELEFTQRGSHDLKVEVEGTGMIANLLRKVLGGFNSHSRVIHNITNKPCLPRPNLMPPIFYLKIYGGYLWILVLLYLNGYTLRLRRLICSYFYARREKQRILHLYNDILKKRMKMNKTLQKKAVQAARAHYLSGETLLSLRLKFPTLLGWLKICPAAKMRCLICGETEPSNTLRGCGCEPWQRCESPKCPFVYCAECWRDAGARCLACDPRLPDLSDADSLTEDEQPRY